MELFVLIKQPGIHRNTADRIIIFQSDSIIISRWKSIRSRKILSFKNKFVRSFIWKIDGDSNRSIDDPLVV